MGVCSSTMCQQDIRANPQEYSIKSLLITYLNQHQSQQWVQNIKQIVTRFSFRNSEKNRYSRQTLAYNDDDYQGQELKSYNKYRSMSAENRATQLNIMLTKAYMIIDQQDMPHNDSKLLLPQLASRNLFTSSLSVSIFGSLEDPETSKSRNQKLIAYDPDILKHLEGFVQFCEDINQEIQIHSSIIYQLVLSFKGSIIQVFKTLISQKSNEGDVSIRKKLVQTSNKFMFFLVQVLTTVYGINKVRIIEKNKSFYSDINLYTLVTSLLFKEQQFEQIVKKVYNFSMIKQLNSFKQNPTSPYSKYSLPVQFSLDKNTLKHLKLVQTGAAYQQKQRTGLFKDTSVQFQPYTKCVKMLSQISSVRQPIGKLKIIYETGLRINKQVQKFYRNYLLPVPTINGQKLLQITKNIMTRCENINAAVEILITSDFIHNYYLISKKGSYLTPFLVSIQPPK